ncbi:alpha/beta fold hydrolase [Actinocrispum wychmicini]|uniref:Pimeloyl-ACP methyl ester carboxylesterase n=1 Tax=Actinocrispum wychmicini TaxID=1213861 RepID=A0A4R2IUB7_9PSEU|nr:alpha/beta fold hydrolase [Actinocrispum wychmicini]TCO48954.1 pimeloyl-ACP methyl ester carboxylesterase [Actinocrispum wychmicini]
MDHRITSFSRDGLTFDVADQGPLDGEIVVLLHGFPQTAASWSALAPLLHAEGYRTLAPNQRGYSPGARPRGRRAYRMSELVEDVLALYRVTGADRVHVIGHDWGAAVAWMLAARRPEVVATLTALSVPHPAAFLKSMVTSGQAVKSWYMVFFQLPWLPELLVRLAHRYGRDRAIKVNMASGQTAENAARDIDFLSGSGALTPAINWYRAMPLSSPGQTRQPVRTRTMLVWGDQDVALGRKGAELTRDYVAGPYTFHALPGVGHWIPEQVPDQLAEFLRPHLAAAT